MTISEERRDETAESEDELHDDPLDNNKILIRSDYSISEVIVPGCRCHVNSTFLIVTRKDPSNC